MNPIDKGAPDILIKTISHNGESYKIGLPWKKPLIIEKNIYFEALSQLKSLHKRLNNDIQLFELTPTTDVEKFYAKPEERQQQEDEKIWYLPVYPGVANAAAKFRSPSLKPHLITGPDLLNNFVEVIRENPDYILTDVRGGLMQIALTLEDQSALRFLYQHEEMVNQYQFNRSIFGANCSNFCAIFGLNRSAEDNAIEFPKAVSITQK